MKKQYKELVIRSIYGFMEGDISTFKESIIDKFDILYGLKPEIHLTFINNPDERKLIAELTINSNEDSFIVTRDMLEEERIDKSHPDYDSDDWFYESDKCYSVQKCHELLNELNK